VGEKKKGERLKEGEKSGLRTSSKGLVYRSPGAEWSAKGRVQLRTQGGKTIHKKKGSGVGKSLFRWGLIN